MKAQEARRKPAARHYDIVIVPSGEGSTPRRFKAGTGKLIGVGAAVFLFCVAVTLAILMFTPIMMVLPLPNPALEARYGKELVETQGRLHTLAQDFLVLRDYNEQLRRALGQTELQHAVADVKAGERLPTPSGPSPTGQRYKRMVFPSDQQEGRAERSSTVPAGTATVVSRTSSPAELPLLLPAEGYISQGFDPSRRHLGIDIAAKSGSPVYAPSDGFVVFAGWTYEDGNILILSHGSGYMTVYKHNQSVLKQVATAVKRGEVIALLGSSGKTSLGPHLHFEVWKDGVPHDPSEVLLTPVRIQ